MGYFVTGATGFIGRNLVELLLKREGTIYVLVREGSKGRLEELRSRWGVDEDRVVGIVGDLAQARLGVSDEDAQKLTGNVDHLFHLAAIYDMKADAESQQVANIDGTRHMVELAEAIDAGCVHMVSSIAAAGLYPGIWREDMFEEAVNLDTDPYFRTKHDSEGIVRNECSRPWRVYRPGIVVGDSETGEMDKVDGPYYFFKLIRRIRNAVPQWLPMAGVEGREINIVPVDFVVNAIDHIAHAPDLDGRAFHLTDPNAMTAGEIIDTFAQAAHAPQTTVRLPARATEALQPILGFVVNSAPLGNTVTDAVLADFGIPRSVLMYMNWPTKFDSRQTQAALAGSGISVPPLNAYAGKLWDYWERHLDPDLYRDKTLAGRREGPPWRGRRRQPGPGAPGPGRGAPLRPARSRQRLAREVRARARRHGHRRLIGHRQVGGDEDRRRRRDRPARRANAREARVHQGPDRGRWRRSRISTARTSPTWMTSSAWPKRCSNSTATSTSS